MDVLTEVPLRSGSRTPVGDLLPPLDSFPRRHLGSAEDDLAAMLATLGVGSLDELADQAVPDSIRLRGALELSGLERGLGEGEALARLRALMQRNRVHRSCIGMGYSGTVVPPVILRNVLENPSWYTQYTPYQAEISQGRLEALLNFQTMIADLTALPVSNASLLDEATAAAEAMAMAHALGRGKRNTFLAANDCHPQTLGVVATRADGLGYRLRVADAASFEIDDDVFGVLLQYPTTDGRILDPRPLIERAHAAGAVVVMAVDLLALTLLRPPGELGADIAIGSAQRFGVPMGYGGPHAAFLATSEEHKRLIPGRIIGVSRDARGNDAYRMAMQTREQHIRREKATSNICTAQVLLAIMAGMYGVYHGPEGLRAIARRVHRLTRLLAAGLRQLGHRLADEPFFDTLRVTPGAGRSTEQVLAAAEDAGFDLRRYADGDLGISLDETTSAAEVAALLGAIHGKAVDLDLAELDNELPADGDDDLAGHRRESAYLEHPVFHRYHTEHEMLRYIHRLAARDLSLTTSMIPLGSCTMKLNATAEMLPVSWPEVSQLHPFASRDHAPGYGEMFDNLQRWLCEITGFAALSLQPNAGSQGEYAGLMVIRAFHRSRGDELRDVCLIPVSAHGTNPASAVMAGMRVVVVACDQHGNIDLADLEAKAVQHRDRLAALMVTYPSTHGVFESRIRRICELVHENGGQVYLDGANLNAQVGLCRPGDYGADVCHLNLHKTFCIPHGGGGPGMGPIGVAEHLAPFLPGHPVVEVGGDQALGPVSAAPWGSPSILPISWMYIAMMGAQGLTRASQVAILNANYMAARLEEHYPILYHGENGRVAHEFILDLRPFQKSAGIGAEDVAKRLMDYGFHSPTMSFPVPGTLMVEPTESESKAELDRFCTAMISIREEIRAIEQGRADRDDNPLKNAPHTVHAVTASEWSHPYSREEAGFPAPWLREHKFWPAVARIDNAWGDRNLICTCPPIEDYEEASR